MEESIYLFDATANLGDQPKPYTFDQIERGFAESEYAENFESGWPFVRCIASYLAYDMGVTFNEEQLEEVREKVWRIFDFRAWVASRPSAKKQA